MLDWAFKLEIPLELDDGFNGLAKDASFVSSILKGLKLNDPSSLSWYAGGCKDIFGSLAASSNGGGAIEGFLMRWIGLCIGEFKGEVNVPSCGLACGEFIVDIVSSVSGLYKFASKCILASVSPANPAKFNSDLM